MARQPRRPSALPTSIGHSAEQVEAMHTAWFKAVTLTALLWCHPYVKAGEF